MAEPQGLVIDLGDEVPGAIPSGGEEEPMGEAEEMMLVASEALIGACEAKDAAAVAQILQDIMAMGAELTEPPLGV